MQRDRGGSKGEAGMKLEALNAARRGCERAREKLGAMSASTDLEAFAILWSEFLTAANRVCTKLEQGAKEGSNKRWFDRIKHTRRVLFYVHQARDADEHGIQPITGRSPSTLSTGRYEAVYIRNMTINGEQ
jgi:hypothetical protein